jgi:hypothetical protein
MSSTDSDYSNSVMGYSDPESDSSGEGMLAISSRRNGQEARFDRF